MNKKFYITTPIYYVNARPHIGHAYTTIACDTIARRQRLLGVETFFLTGTDEHGQKIERAAQAAGKTPQHYADEISAEFRQLWKRMGISNDDFIRTTEDRHKKRVQELFRRIRDNGYIYKGTYTGQSLPHLRARHRDCQGRELFFQALHVSGQAAGIVCES
jgi:methionyl-tRNA synthetase